jgi:hypothetical protein
MFKRLPIHPFTFAIFPILTLLAYNITEVEPRIALRSVIISIICSTLLFIIISLILRNWQKAAIVTTFILILFYSYGQVYEFLQAHAIFGFNFGRHRYLVVIYALILVVGLWAIFFKVKNILIYSQILNIVGILMLIYPSIKIVNYTIHTKISEQRLSVYTPMFDTSILTKPKTLPDIYFIVLDGYGRGDALLKDYGFDNSPFLDNLSLMGLYVADCSRSNYGSTHESITTALNMDYLSVLRSEMENQGYTNSDDVWILLKQSKVRSLLKSMGYKTVAFESGFEWTRIRDADIYLQYTGVPYEMQVFQPFEAMLIRSTALLLWSDSTYRALPTYTHTIFGATNFEFEDHINRQLYILDELPHIPSIPGPKFIFVHILIPHPPFVFKANGDIQTDPAFYSRDGFWPIDAQHTNEGYINEIEFINSRMTDILDTIISRSNVPPIIVLMGDHGSIFADHNLNLNAYFLPNNGAQALYSSITPVNSFRVIFDTYFGTHFGLLDDISYSDKGENIPETSPACLP